MIGKLLFGCMVSLVVVCNTVSQGFAEDAAEKKKEKSELAKIMEKIDENYKAVEQISGYYKFSDEEWKIIKKSSKEIVQLTKEVIRKFSRPDDRKYQNLNSTMLEEAKKMHEITNHKGEEGALEDAQWQVRRLRQTCALCHKHLGIHIYPNLYPKKQEELPLDLKEIPSPEGNDIPKGW